MNSSRFTWTDCLVERLPYTWNLNDSLETALPNPPIHSGHVRSREVKCHKCDKPSTNSLRRLGVCTSRTAFRHPSQDIPERMLTLTSQKTACSSSPYPSPSFRSGHGGLEHRSRPWILHWHHRPTNCGLRLRPPHPVRASSGKFPHPDGQQWRCASKDKRREQTTGR